MTVTVKAGHGKQMLQTACPIVPISCVCVYVYVDGGFTRGSLRQLLL